VPTLRGCCLVAACRQHGDDAGLIGSAIVSVARRHSRAESRPVDTVPGALELDPFEPARRLVPFGRRPASPKARSGQPQTADVSKDRRSMPLSATSGLMHRSKRSPIRLARRRGRTAAGRGSFKLAHRSPRFDFAQVNLSQTVKCCLPDSDRGRLPSTKRVTDVTQ